MLNYTIIFNLGLVYLKTHLCDILRNDGADFYVLHKYDFLYRDNVYILSTCHTLLLNLSCDDFY